MNKAHIRIKAWRENPIFFVRENFGVEPDEWQKEVLTCFAHWKIVERLEPDGSLKRITAMEHLRISMQACAGPGKSAVLAWCGWNFLSCYGEVGEHPKGAAVSVTQSNLEDNLWVELSKWQQRSEYLKAAFTWTKTRIYANDHKETWFLSARSFPKTADSEAIGKTLSGMHGKFVLFLIDESGDIPPEIGKAAEQAVGEAVENGGFCKVLQAGNPISTNGLLYSAAQSSLWTVVRITGDPEDVNRSPRINKEWAEIQIREHGREDPWVMSYILGEFPKTALNSLLSVEEVEKAMMRNPDVSVFGHAQKRLGVDVAREGMDCTVIFPRQGLASFNYITMRKANGPEVADRVILAKAKWDSEMELVDDTGGFGASAIDSLILKGHTPIGIHFSSNANNKKRYANRRAEMWYEMAQWVKRGGALPDCRRLLQELTTVKYFIKHDRIQIESKDQIKARLKRSPDISDALALTFALPDMPAKDEYEYLRKQQNQGHESKYNRLDEL